MFCKLTNHKIMKAFALCFVPKLRGKLGEPPITKAMGNLLYHIATKFKGSRERASMLVEYVGFEKLKSELQLNG